MDFVELPVISFGPTIAFHVISYNGKFYYTYLSQFFDLEFAFYQIEETKIDWEDNFLFASNAPKSPNMVFRTIPPNFCFVGELRHEHSFLFFSVQGLTLLSDILEKKASTKADFLGLQVEAMKSTLETLILIEKKKKLVLSLKDFRIIYAETVDGEISFMPNENQPFVEPLKSTEALSPSSFSSVLSPNLKSYFPNQNISIFSPNSISPNNLKTISPPNKKDIHDDSSSRKKVKKNESFETTYPFNPSDKYRCDCGKTFGTSQAKAGHCHFCPIHLNNRNKKVNPGPVVKRKRIDEEEMDANFSPSSPIKDKKRKSKDILLTDFKPKKDASAETELIPKPVPKSAYVSTILNETQPIPAQNDVTSSTRTEEVSNPTSQKSLSPKSLQNVLSTVCSPNSVSKMSDKIIEGVLTQNVKNLKSPRRSMFSPDTLALYAATVDIAYEKNLNGQNYYSEWQSKYQKTLAECQSIDGENHELEALIRQLELKVSETQSLLNTFG